MCRSKEADISKYKTPKRIIFTSAIIGVLPIVPTVLAVLISTIFDIGLSERAPPNVPLGELLYVMALSFWLLVFSIPIGAFGVFAGLIWSLCVFIGSQADQSKQSE